MILYIFLCIHFCARESPKCTLSRLLSLFKCQIKDFSVLHSPALKESWKPSVGTSNKEREHAIPCAIKLLFNTLEMQRRESLEVSGRDQRKETNGNKKTAIKDKNKNSRAERMKHFCGKVRGWDARGGRDGGRWAQRSVERWHGSKSMMTEKWNEC